MAPGEIHRPGQVAWELHVAQASDPSRPMSTVNTQGIDQLLQELNRLAAQAGGQSEPAAGGADFGAALQSAMQQVNAAQQDATRLQQEFDLNLQRSWMIGQTTADVLSAQRAELGTILVRTGKAGQDGEFQVEPHFVEDDLCNAVARVNQFEYSLRM